MESKAVAERVRSLIAGSGFETHEQFANAIGIDQTKLSKSLNDHRRFTSLELAQIASAGGVTVDWLLNGQAESLAARFSPMSTGEVSSVVEEARRIAEARENLAFLGIKPELPSSPAVTSSLWIDQGNELAHFALEHLGMPQVGGGTEDFAAAIERVFNVDVRVMDTSGACDGLALQTADARVMVVASGQKPTRQRFTMAHELCHLLCGDDQGDLHVDQDIMSPASKRGSSEVRANVFAAALLMPEVLLRERRPVEPSDDAWFHALVMDLMVSPSALSWRLFNLKMIDEEERRRFGRLATVQSASDADRLAEYSGWIEASESTRVPTSLIRDVLGAYLERKTTLQPLANLLRAKIEDVRAAVEDATVEGEESDEFVP